MIPVNANAYGTTYGELAGDWWNWAVIEPEASNPVADETGEFADANQSGKIWFLAGTFGNDVSDPIEQSVTVPTGKAIFFPVPNNVYFATEPEETEELLRELVNDATDNPQSPSVTIDGQDIDASKYRAEFPAGGFTLSIPEGSLFTAFVPADDYAPAVADGYWILLAPLSRGTHEISFSGVAKDGFSVSVSYEIEVVGGKKDAQIAVPVPAIFTSTETSDEDTDLALVELALADEGDEKAPTENSNRGGNKAVVLKESAVDADNTSAKKGGDKEVDLALLDLVQLGV